MTLPDLSRLRQEYAAGGLAESDLTADPLTLFGRWLEQALDSGLYEPNAMMVASVGDDGRPSSRMVLLKGLDSGFVFYTNYESRKGIELTARPDCALLFPWHPLQRQVRVEGTAEPIAEEESATYFSSRPRGSQLGAWASPQSQVVVGREELDERYAEMEDRFGADDVPRPGHWGGFRVVPLAVEFWQGRPGRMHDRLRYRRADAASPWSTERLAP